MVIDDLSIQQVPGTSNEEDRKSALSKIQHSKPTTSAIKESHDGLGQLPGTKETKKIKKKLTEETSKPKSQLKMHEPA